jgi:hypothetical protein
MAQMDITIDALPPGALIFQAGIADTPGVVAANNFVSLFNPVGSGITIGALGFIVQSYTTGNSTSSNSLQTIMTTAASGGTLLAASQIYKFDSGQRNSKAEWRTGNPTVTTTGLPILSIAPINASSGGATIPALLSPGGGAPPVLHPGEGVVYRTAGGNTSQMWNIVQVWVEF